MIKIILADDHAMIRDGIKLLLEKDNVFEVTALAADGQEVIDLLDAGAEAELILADINMPGLGGIEMAAYLKNSDHAIKVALFSVAGQEHNLAEALAAGVQGYFLKNGDLQELIFGLQRICNGMPYICQELSMTLARHFLKKQTQLDHPDFSNRELEVLNLVADGYSNKEIADKLFTSRRTVEGHRLSMLSKTGSRNTYSLIKYAVSNGIID